MKEITQPDELLDSIFPARFPSPIRTITMPSFQRLLCSSIDIKPLARPTGSSTDPCIHPSSHNKQTPLFLQPLPNDSKSHSGKKIITRNAAFLHRGIMYKHKRSSHKSEIFD